MKKIIFSLAIAAIAFTANAQDAKKSDKDLKFSVGVEAGVPVGTISSYSSFAVGGSLQGEYAAAEKVGITLNAGYLNFSGKNGAGSSGMVPVLAGVKVFFSENFFGHAQAGMSFSTQTGGGSAFTYSPGLGYQASQNFEITAKYQAATKNGFTTSFVGIRAAYIF